MELTAKHIIDNISKFLCEEAAKVRKANEFPYLYWNYDGGHWDCSAYYGTHEWIMEVEKGINWVYAVCPYVDVNGRISGNKPMKGFISKHDGEYVFVTTKPINDAINESYYPIESDDTFGKLTIFSNLKEARLFGLNFQKESTPTTIQEEIQATMKQLAEVQERLNRLLQMAKLQDSLRK